MSAPLVWLPLRSWYFDPASGLAVTANVGSAGPTLQLGDGSTSATFPTMITPASSVRRGVNTGATSRGINHLTLPALGSNGSVVVQASLSPASLSLAQTLPMAIGGLAGFGYATGWMMSQYQNQLRGYWGSAGITTSSAVLTPGVHTFAMTNDGSLVTLYMDGAVVGTPTAPGGSATNVGCGIGGVLNAAFNGLQNSAIYHASIWSASMTRQQMRVLHERLMSELSS
jgi:hypothetical protein